MASIVTSQPLTPSSSSDIVAVFTQSFVQVFRLARPVKSSVKLDSKPMEQPLEDGATIVDHRILLPIEIEIFFLIPSVSYRVTYDQMKQLYDLGTLLFIQTRTGIYRNLFIQSLPADEDPDQYDIIKMDVNFKEAKFVTPSFAPAPANPSNSNTKNRGNISSTEKQDVSELRNLTRREI